MGRAWRREATFKLQGFLLSGTAAAPLLGKSVGPWTLSGSTLWSCVWWGDRGGEAGEARWSKPTSEGLNSKKGCYALVASSWKKGLSRSSLRWPAEPSEKKESLTITRYTPPNKTYK